MQRLARQAVRDVRQAVTGSLVPSLQTELAAAEAALEAAGIQVNINVETTQVDPAHETTVAWALREAITNVVKHSGAQTCAINVHSVDGSTNLTVEGDGRRRRP